MKITCLVIGKTTEKYFIDAIDEYTSRLKHYIPFEGTVIPELKNVKNVSVTDQKEKEADLILKNILFSWMNMEKNLHLSNFPPI